MRYVLLVSYDGTDYGGWQIQNNAVTVQEKLTSALSETLGKKVSVTASGRTDSGVHASAQVCHFDAETSIPPEKFADALNFRLPDDISVLKSALAPEGFDAVRSAKKKTYCYRAYISPRRLPLKDRYAVRLKLPVDIEKLKKGAKMLEGEHDFSAYCSAGSQVKTTVRTVYSREVKTRKTGDTTDIELYVTGNGFLYNMVRTLAGTVFYYASGRITEEDIMRSLKEGDRNSVGKTLPPNGLTLESVDYGIPLFLQ